MRTVSLVVVDPAGFKLIGATAASPIMSGQGGGTDQWTFGIGLTYFFAMSELPF